MEVFDDWTAEERATVQPQGASRLRNRLVSAGAVREALAGFRPEIVNVHCYTEVEYRWVQVVFDETIGPGVALDLGDRLAKAVGEDNVYFNSLRPRAVYFLFEPSAKDEAEMPASRYGTRIAEIRTCWMPGASKVRAERRRA